MSNLLGPNNQLNVDMTTTVESLATQLSLYTKLQAFFNVGQRSGQPMLQIAQNINQLLLIRRMAWKWNRRNLGENNPAKNPHFFIAQQGFQDYLFAGASCFTLINSTTPGGQLPAGGAGVDLNPGVYANGLARVQYGVFNGGNSYGPTGSWQNYGVVFDPSNNTFTVQFLDPHPFLPGNIGTSVMLIQGMVNPAYNSQFVYNQLTQLSGWINGYTLLSIPDQFHIVLQGNGGQMNTVASISATGGTTTVTLVNPNPLPVYPQNNFNGVYSAANTSGNGIGVGSIMTFTGVTTNSALNGVSVVITGVTGTTVSFATPTGVTITNGSDTGTIYAASSGAPGIFDLGWIESAALVDINNPSFPLPVTPIDAVHRIPPEYTSTGDNLSLSCEVDFGNGVLKFRLSEPVSTYPFAFNVVYQVKPPTFTSGQSIFRWPDSLSYVLFECALAQGYRFAYGLTAAETELQMRVANQAVMDALSSEDREANDFSITPQWSLFR